MVLPGQIQGCSDQRVETENSSSRGQEHDGVLSSSEEAYQRLSYAVLNPESEPVDVATRQKMTQLHGLFQSQNLAGAGGIDASDRDITLEKGTLCTDRGWSFASG
jgi:hypothetical protein